MATKSRLDFADFHPAADGVTDDAAKFNAMFAQAEAEDIAEVYVPPGKYAVASNISLPQKGSSQYKKLKISGYGAIIEATTTNVTIFDRSITNVGDISTTAYVPTIEGFCFRGPAANTATSGTGLRWDGAHCGIFRDLDFQNLNNGFFGVWCMECLVERCHVQGTLNSYTLTNGDGGRISDGTHNNSSSNNSVLRHCRTQLSDANAVGVKLWGGGNLRVENTTIEGSLGSTAVTCSTRSESDNLDRRRFVLDQLWIETTTLATVISADLYRSSVVANNIQVPSRSGTTPNETVFLDDTTSQDASFVIAGCDFYNWNGTTDPWFKNINRGAGDETLFRFEGNIMHPSTSDITATGLWSNGTPVPAPTGYSHVRGTSTHTF